MKRCLVLILAVGLVLSSIDFASAKQTPKKGKKAATEQNSTPKESKYKKTFSSKSGCVSAEGEFITLHKVDSKLYLEIPRENLGSEVLIAATVTGTSDSDVATIGYKARQPLYGRFVARDSSVFLERIAVLPDFNPADTAGAENIRLMNLDPVVAGGKLFCESDDKKSVVFDATALFRTLDDLSPLGKRSSMGLTIKSTLNADQSTFDTLKSFPDNVSVKSTLTYKVTTSFLGLITVLRDEPVSVKVTHTILLLPKEKMRSRVADSRIGTFLTDRKTFGANADKVVNYSVVNRWRLEPADTVAFLSGELSEPVKPIVFYLDSAFPEAWRHAATTGIMRWNKAFEAIGFKNVVRVEPFPTDDPEFDPDNLKYSCIRYVPTAVSNAMGPSWVDPSTGEIINASVLVYNDVAKLINNWRFSQTAQIDERVRAVKMPVEVMDESLAYVLAHEVGHCLGFMHNMAASNAYPVDSLRDAHFTAKYGTTPSIMDYARFNYVAQPGDKGVKLTPPDLGVYDYYLIKYTYQPIFEAKTMEEERPVLSAWIEEKQGDPRYRYGRQQVTLRCDPTAIEEDLGDDAIRASDYGVKNLKYVLSNLESWIPDSDDPDFLHRGELYAAILKQYNRYVQAVMMNVGGIKLFEGNDRPRTESVDAAYQRKAAKWVLAQLDDCEWIDRTGVNQQQTLHVENSSTFASKTFSDLLDKVKAVVLSAHISEADRYLPEQLVDDIYASVWRPTIANKKLTTTERMMQTDFVNACIAPFAKKSSSSGSSSLTATGAFQPSVHQVLVWQLPLVGESDEMDEMIDRLTAQYGTDEVTERMFGKAGYNWQKRVSISSIDETPGVWYAAAQRCEKLLSSKAAYASGADKSHYSILLYRLRKALSDK